MEDEHKTKEELVEQLEQLRQRVAEFGDTEASRQSTGRLAELVRERTEELTTMNEALQLEIAERKQAEEVAHLNEERYRLLLDNALIGFLFVDKEGRILEVNRKLLEVLGSPSTEATKAINILTFPPLVAAGISEVFERCMVEGKVVNAELPYTSKWGKDIVVRLLLSPIMDSEGHVTGCQAAVEDVTARKRAEEELRRSEERYRIIIETIEDGYYETDIAGNLRFFNDPVCRVLGHSRAELIGMNNRQFMDEANARKTYKAFNEVHSTGQANKVFDVELIGKDGSKRIVALSISLARDSQGQPSGFRGICRDVTERKNAEEALRQSEEKYRLVVDNANEAIFVAQDGMIKFVNPRGASLVGYSAEELTSRPFLDFIHPEDRAMVIDRHVRRLNGETLPEVYEFRVIDKPGNIIWAEISAVAVDWEGRPATLNFLADVTAKRKMEDELFKIEKLESLGVLAGGIAHDFNNILTAILGNISLARMSADSPTKVVSKLTEAEKACFRAQGLTQQLLTFSKGGAPIKKTLPISDIVRDSCVFALRGSNVGCDFSIPEKLWAIEADEGQIGQVINNLIINASQAMPQGGRIHVSAENVLITAEIGLSLRDGKYLRLMIKDEGVGIPEKILPRIFDPYFTTKQKGSGLGLATSYSIVKNHDGLIQVESEVGVGTTVCVYLPASEKQIAPARDSQPAMQKGKGRILVMDDEESIRSFAEEMLSLLGYEVELAKDGAEAVDIYANAKEASRPFDAVILDLTVPGGMGGGEAMAKLRERYPEVRGIVCSGYGNDPVMADCEKQGFSGVVAKPYTPKELVQVLNRVILGDER